MTTSHDTRGTASKRNEEQSDDRLVLVLFASCERRSGSERVSDSPYFKGFTLQSQNLQAEGGTRALSARKQAAPHLQEESSRRPQKLHSMKSLHRSRRLARGDLDQHESLGGYRNGQLATVQITDFRRR
jgi:hypothetical protein